MSSIFKRHPIQEDTFFTKEMSTMMSGVAILMMLTLHLFLFPPWWKPGVEWTSFLGDIGNYLTEVISSFGGICVTLYAMMSGYSLIVSPHSYDTLQKRLQRLFKFLISYWLACILFIIFGYLTNDTLPSIHNFVLNLIGMRTAPCGEWINVPFGWYVSFYIEFIMLSPILLWIFSSKSIFVDISSLLAIIICVFLLKKCSSCGILSVSCGPFIASSCGLLVAKYNILSRLHTKYTSHYSKPILLALIALLIISRKYFVELHPAGGKTWLFVVDCSYNGFALLLTLLCVEYFHRIGNGLTKIIFKQLGVLSIYFWFLHGIFFAGNSVLQRFLYAVKDPLLILLICIISLLPIALMLKYIHKSIFTRCNNFIPFRTD